MVAGETAMFVTDFAGPGRYAENTAIIPTKALVI